MSSPEDITLNQNAALVDVLDRVLDKGVVVQGDAMLSVADVDLVYLGLRLVLCSVDRLNSPPTSATPPVIPPAIDPDDALSSTLPNIPAQSSAMPSISDTDLSDNAGVSAQIITADLPDYNHLDNSTQPTITHSVIATDVDTLLSPSNYADNVSSETHTSLMTDTTPTDANGLVQLVLSLVELLRELMERQAIHRMDRGTLTEQQIKQLGDTFMKLNDCMETLKTHFGLTDDDLNLDLGPLGNLLES